MANVRQQAENQRIWAESSSCYSGGQALTNNEYEAIRKQNTLDYEKPQREWVSLTDDEIWKLVWQENSRVELARAIEAKLKEKNS